MVTSVGPSFSSQNLLLLLQHSLLLSLEEMYHGCVKKVTHERQVVKADGTSATEQRELNIDVSFCLPHCLSY